MYYPRRILSVLTKQIDTPEIVVLTGMRRVGISIQDMEESMLLELLIEQEC